MTKNEDDEIIRVTTKEDETQSKAAITKHVRTERQNNSNKDGE